MYRWLLLLAPLQLLIGCAGGEAPGADLSNAADVSVAALLSSGTVAITPTSAQTLCLQPQDGKTTNGIPVVLGNCDSSAAQGWKLTGTSLTLNDTKCLDVVNGANADGTRLQLWDCATNNINQHWSMVGGTLSWVGTNKCLDVSNGLMAAGTALQVWTCSSGNKNQAWTAIASEASAALSSAALPSGYVQVSGTSLYDGSGHQLVLRGTNLGGWLVQETWMDGITDNSDPTYRFTRETLESRFGDANTLALPNVWYDQFLTSADFDNMKEVGINVVRLPFGWRNLQHKDGTWVTNSAGKIDFSRLDWAVQQAGSRGIYVILDFHIWDSQQASYSQISQNTADGNTSRAHAAKIWTEVAAHYKNSNIVAAFDAINEPIGSYANLLQDSLYKAIRAQDANRVIIMESMNADPSTLGWKQVVYSIHEYNMMGTDFVANQAAFNGDLNGSLASFRRFKIPAYIGEFMVQDSGPTLAWLLQQYNTQNLSWTNWTYKAVNMGSWALYNLPSSAHIDAQNDSYARILSVWQNLGKSVPETNLINAMKAANGH